MNDERYLVHEMRRLSAKIEGLQGEILATQRELERVLEQIEGEDYPEQIGGWDDAPVSLYEPSG